VLFYIVLLRYSSQKQSISLFPYVSSVKNTRILAFLVFGIRLFLAVLTHEVFHIAATLLQGYNKNELETI